MYLTRQITPCPESVKPITRLRNRIKLVASHLKYPHFRWPTIRPRRQGRQLRRDLPKLFVGIYFHARTHTCMHACMHTRSIHNLSILHLPRSDTEMPVYRKRDRKRERNRDRKELGRNGEFLSAFSPLTFLHPELRVRKNMFPTLSRLHAHEHAFFGSSGDHSRSLVPQPLIGTHNLKSK